MATNGHTWTFMVAATGEEARGRVVVVCTVCGVTRSGFVPVPANLDHFVDLRGECPGEAQQPTGRPIERSLTTDA